MSMATLSFQPLSVFVDAAFWSEVNRRKLHEWRLDETPTPIRGVVTNADSEGTSSRLSLSFDSFPPFRDTSGFDGQLVVLNTLEAFRDLDRKAILTAAANELWRIASSDEWLQNPNALNSLIFTAFADLKKFDYVYWACIPALAWPQKLSFARPPQVLEDASLVPRLHTFHTQSGQFAFAAVFIDGAVEVVPLSEATQFLSKEWALVFADPSTLPLVPGWPLRNLIAAFCRRFSLRSLRVVSLRQGLPSFSFELALDYEPIHEAPAAVGWERSNNDKLEPRRVNLLNTFDPLRLMEQSVGLNLSLIKWRLIPDLELSVFSDLKVLIFGAGTLGCNLARGLLGWGVRKFVFVDNSHVSYSNPVRQSLSEFTDAKEHRSKAETVVLALKRIFPVVEALAVQLTVPMPGHRVSPNEEEEVRLTVDRVEALIRECDVSLLALDSREARWLPTLLAARHSKFAMSIALGFDSYVVIRHGIGRNVPSLEPSSLNMPLSANQLSCYFCSDVTAPGNSTADRTLDQQCTVSRAGLSMVASGVAVEVLASCAQHNPPFVAPSNVVGEPDDSTTRLGAAPHQVRGFLSRFHQLTPCVRRFERCVACGDAVLDNYQHRGFNFIREVLNDPSTLERVTGLDQLQASIDPADVLTFDDSDSLSFT